MGHLFSVDIASGITDRVASVVKEVDDAIAALTVITNRDTNGVFQVASASENYFVEKDFITPGYNFDQFLVDNSVVKTANETKAMVTALENHCSTNNGTNFDTFCNNSGLKVDEIFARTYAISRTNGMLAHNVYASISNRLLAAVQKTGASTYSSFSGVSLNTGSTSRYVSPTYYTGESIILARLPSGVSTSSCAMRASGLNDAGQSVQAAFTFPTGTPAATVQVSASIRFRTISNIDVDSSTGIPIGTTVTLISQPERVINY